MTADFHDLQDIKVNPLILMRFMLFVQTLVLFSVFYGLLFVFSFLSEYTFDISNQWLFLCLPMYLSGLVVLDCSFLCSILQITVYQLSLYFRAPEFT